MVEKKRTGKTSRTQTGIIGFDELLEGGFPTNSSILIAGGPGTGKSIFVPKRRPLFNIIPVAVEPAQFR